VNFWWGNNERVIMSVTTVTGNLDTQNTRPPSLYAADIDGKRREQIFDTQRSSFQFLHPYPQDPRRILIARYHFADGGQPKAQLLDIYSGDLDYLADQPNSRDIRQLIADNDGTLRVAVELIDADEFDDIELNLFVKKGEQWTRFRVDSERERPDIVPLGFSADNTKLYLASNHDMAENDRAGVFRYDLTTDALDLLYRHPAVDVSAPMVGSDGEVLGVFSRFGPGTYTFLEDKATTNTEAILMQRLAASFPADDVSFTSYSEDGAQATLFVRGDRNPGEFYFFDIETMAASYLAAVRPDLPKEALVPMETHRIKARDGMMLHALLTLPKGQSSNLPLIVNVHGGPFASQLPWLRQSRR
jgi:dipeptidyl aminopeptidase/acylaminoacyl peptidase